MCVAKYAFYSVECHEERGIRVKIRIMNLFHGTQRIRQCED